MNNEKLYQKYKELKFDQQEFIRWGMKNKIKIEDIVEILDYKYILNRLKIGIISIIVIALIMAGIKMYILYK